MKIKAHIFKTGKPYTLCGRILNSNLTCFSIEKIGEIGSEGIKAMNLNRLLCEVCNNIYLKHYRRNKSLFI